MSSLALFPTVKVRYSEQGSLYSAGYNRRSLAALHSQTQCRWSDVRMESGIFAHYVVACVHVGKTVDRLFGLKFSLKFPSVIPFQTEYDELRTMSATKLPADIYSLLWYKPRIKCSWSSYSFHITRGVYCFYFIYIGYVCFRLTKCLPIWQ